MSTIKTQVMASVAVIRAARAVSGAAALKAYAILLSLWGIGRLAWVSKVFENFSVAQSHGAAAARDFMITAVAHAHAGVQLMLVIAALAAFSLFADAFRAVPARARLAA